MTDAELVPEPAWFERLDPGPDAAFYATPRFVNHIDEATITALTAYYAEVLPAGASVLDLMSSWVSHLPPAPALGRVSGLGMNAEELAANPRLDDFNVTDLNAAGATLPYADAAFDFALIAVSVQYLVQPVAVFRELARVLKPAGRVVIALSHRCFPTKAARVFHGVDGAARMAVVSACLTASGCFARPLLIDRSPVGADPLWIVDAASLPVEA